MKTTQVYYLKDWKLVRYIQCFFKHGLWLHLTSSSTRFLYLTPADFVFERFYHPLLHMLSHISWVFFIFFFFTAHPEGCLGGLLFFGQSVICSAFILSCLEVCFLARLLLFLFTVFKIAIDIVRADTKEYFITTRPPNLSFSISGR